MANLKLNVHYIKILETVSSLNKNNYYPNPHGVLKILNGKKDDEAIKFKYIKTYGTLTSIKAKKIANDIHQLVRYNFLSYKLNKANNTLYLKISIKGEENLQYFYKHHKVNYLSKKEKTIEPDIVLIND